MIKTLVQHNLFYMLHQFLQYHVLSDSKPLVSPPPEPEDTDSRSKVKSFFLCVFEACLLLSLESTYPPAHQLSLDMLKVHTHSHTDTEVGGSHAPCVSSVCPQPTMRSWRFCCPSIRFWLRSDSSAALVR